MFQCNGVREYFYRFDFGRFVGTFWRRPTLEIIQVSRRNEFQQSGAREYLESSTFTSYSQSQR